MINNDKEKKVNQIIDLLNEETLNHKVEILANVFIRLGVVLIKQDSDFKIKNVTRYVLDDLERNGETLANALARQGLIILSWISKE